MKKYLLIFILLIGAYGVSAQTVTPTPTPVPINCTVTPSNPKCAFVQVRQGFVDDATEAFKLVQAQRDAINKFLNERKLDDNERAAWERVRASLEDVIAIYGQKDLAYQSLVKVYDQMIKIQGDIIDRLEKQLNKKKSFLDKVLDAIKNATILLAGVALGRGL